MGKIPRRRKTSRVFSRSKKSKVTPKTTITQKLKRTLRNTYGRKMKVNDSHKHKHKHKRKHSWKKTYKGKHEREYENRNKHKLQWHNNTR